MNLAAVYIYGREIKIYGIILKELFFLRPTPQKTYLIGESAFRSNEGGEQHG